MPNLFAGIRQSGQVDWIPVHGDRGREFETHYGFFVVDLEKISLLYTAFPLLVIEMHSGNCTDVPKLKFLYNHALA